MAIEHNVIPANQVHPLPGLGPYANEATRLAATPAVGDVGKAAIQTDTGALWELASSSPIRWQRIAGPTPIRDKGGTAFTFTIDDVDALSRTTNGSAVSGTIPPNSSVPCVAGDTLLVFQKGAGLFSFVAGAGVTLRGTSLVSAGQYSTLFATCLGSDEWVVGGKTT